MTMDTHINENENENVKIRLEKMGYDQPFSQTSLPLIRKLMDDLTQSRNDLQISQMVVQSNSNSVPPEELKGGASVKTGLFKEISIIRRKYLQLKEKTDFTIKGKEDKIAKLSLDLEREKLTNTALSDKIYDLQVENHEMTEKLRDWQKNSTDAIVHTDDPQKPPKIELSSLFPPTQVNNNMLNSYLRVAPSLTDQKLEVLRLTEERIADLHIELERLRRIIDAGDEVINECRKQITTRDSEIIRLERMLSHQAILSESTMAGASHLETSLKQEMNRMLKKCQELQNEIRVNAENAQNALDQARDSELRNKALERRLDNLTNHVKKLEQEKRTIQIEADREICTAKNELTRAQVEIEKLTLRLNDCERSLNVHDGRCSSDNRDVDHLLAHQNYEKSRLLEKIEKLSLRHERLLSKERVRHQLKDPRVDKIQDLLKSVECDRNYWKRLAYDLDKRLRNRMDSGFLSSNRNKNDPYVITVESELGRTPERNFCCPDSVASTPGHDIDGKIRSENINLRRELEKCLNEIERLTRKLSPSNKAAIERFRTENEQLREERDNMRTLMDKFERHLSEIQGNVKVLTQERDSLKRLYEEANNELRRARNENIEAGVKGSRQTAAAQSIVRRLEDEKEETMTDLLRMTTERDSLKERLRSQTENHLTEKASLQQTVEDLQCRLRRSEAVINELTNVTNEVRERAEMLDRQNQELQEQIKCLIRDKDSETSRRRALESQIEELIIELNGSRDKITRLECENDDLRAEIHDVSDQNRALNEHANSLATDLNTARENCKRFESQLSSLENGNRDLENRERGLSDQLQRAENELRNQERNNIDLQNTISSLQEEYHRAEGIVNSQAEEIAELTKSRDHILAEMSCLKNALDEVRRDKNKICEEMNMLQRALNEAQNEIQEHVEAREHFKHLAEQNRNALRQSEEILRQRDVKLDEMSNELRKANCEVDNLRMHVSNCENQMANLQQAISEKQEQLINKAKAIQDLENELRNQQGIIDQLEKDRASQVKINGHLEAQIKDLVGEKEQLLGEVAGLRNIASEMERERDAVVHKLEAAIADNRQLLDSNRTMEGDLVSMREAISELKRNIAHMEGLLAAAGEAEYAHSLELEGKTNELAAIRSRLEVSETKQHEMARELNRLRSRNAELDDDLQRVGRSLMLDGQQSENEAKRCSHGCYHSPECLNNITVGPHDPNACDHGCIHSDECRREVENQLRRIYTGNTD